MTTRLLHCEQHHLFADSLGVVLRHRGHDVTWISGPREVSNLHGSFEICLTSAYFRDVSVTDGLAMLRESTRATRVVVLTARDEPEISALALGSGADAVIAKTAPLEMTLQTIEGSRRGHVTCPSRTTPHQTSRVDADRVALTPREQQVLAELASGHSTRQIAANLGVAPTTARTYIQSILTKFDVHSKVQAVALAFTLQLVHPATLATRSGLPSPSLAAPR